jgi:hypothetical protein
MNCELMLTNFPMVIRFKLQSSERFKWSEFNINDPDFKFQSQNAIIGLKRHNPWILNEQNVSFPLYLQRKECFTTVTYIHYM